MRCLLVLKFSKLYTAVPWSKDQALSPSWMPRMLIESNKRQVDRKAIARPLTYMLPSHHRIQPHQLRPGFPDAGPRRGRVSRIYFGREKSVAGPRAGRDAPRSGEKKRGGALERLF